MELELNIWIAILVFGISLPVAVMFGAALLGLRDAQSKAAGVVRLLTCAAILLAGLLLFGSGYASVMGFAFALVTTLHLLAYWGLRFWVRSNSKT